jgi:hypothetical protein
VISSSRSWVILGTGVETLSAAVTELLSSVIAAPMQIPPMTDSSRSKA